MFHPRPLASRLAGFLLGLIGRCGLWIPATALFTARTDPPPLFPRGAALLGLADAVKAS